MKRKNPSVVTVALAACIATVVVGTALPTAHARPVLGEGSAKATAAVSEVHLIDGTTQTGWTTMLINTLKTANKTDLFVDVSMESGLTTHTLVSSKNGNKQTASAEAEIRIRVLIDGQEAYPGEVIFSRRMQQLSATFQGLIETCFTIDENGNVVLDESCVQPEELELVLDTMDANSFNFIYPDCTPGVHVVEVQCLVTSDTSAEEENYAEAYATVGKGSCTVEAVRMVQGEIVLQ